MLRSPWGPQVSAPLKPLSAGPAAPDHGSLALCPVAPKPVLTLGKVRMASPAPRLGILWGTRPPPVHPEPPGPPLPRTPCGDSVAHAPQPSTRNLCRHAVPDGNHQPCADLRYLERNARFSSSAPGADVRGSEASRGQWLPRQTERVGDFLSSRRLLLFQIRCSHPGATLSPGTQGGVWGRLWASRWGCSGRRGGGGWGHCSAPQSVTGPASAGPGGDLGLVSAASPPAPA